MCSSFFLLVSSWDLDRPSFLQHTYYTILLAVCQGFLRNFFNFLRLDFISFTPVEISLFIDYFPAAELGKCISLKYHTCVSGTNVHHCVYLFLSLGGSGSLCCPSLDYIYIIPHNRAFVNTFSQLFCVFYKRIFIHYTCILCILLVCLTNYLVHLFFAGLPGSSSRTSVRAALAWERENKCS